MSESQGEEPGNKKQAPGFKSAFVALVGRPNCGKSTLLNTVIGENIAIVTPLPQTTRSVFRGIYNDDKVQLVFIDTPGIHRGKHTFNKAMYEQSAGVLRGDTADIACYIADLSRPLGEEEDAVAAMVLAAGMPVVVVLNKIDICPDVPAAKKEFFERYPGLLEKPCITVSALTKKAKQTLLDALVPLAKLGPKYFPEEDLTDADMRFIAAEFIRKKVIELTREEVPHAVFVEILKYEETAEGHFIDANIHVETDGQKAIVIGARGSVIQKIGLMAGKDLEDLAGAKVYVKCHVRVTPHWRDNPGFLKSMGVDMGRGKNPGRR